MGFLDFLFGSKKNQVEEFINKGAVVIDVRTQREWNNGHIENSIHIPLDQLQRRLAEIKKLNKPIITVCESGVRSGNASKFLKENNLEAVNGGGWKSFSRHVSM